MTDAPVIEVSGLRRTFRINRRNTVSALGGVDCALRAGTCLAVVGESGSGKSTLARIVVGLESADAGTVRIAGRPVVPTTSRRHLRERAREVQMVFQNPQGSLNRSLPVSATVDEILRIHRTDLDRQARRARVEELFAEVGLSGRHLDARPAALSGGQQQRVAIARALAAEPRIIVLDEAVSALDVSVQAQVLDLLKRLRTQHELSYLFITHDLSVVRDIAEDVIVMRRGRVVEHGAVDEVLDSPQDPYTRVLIESAPRPGWAPRRSLRSRQQHAASAAPVDTADPTDHSTSSPRRRTSTA